jgi:hypothetical protein
MKKIFSGLLLIIFLGVSFNPISVHASTAADNAKQIELLKTLIVLLQTRLVLLINEKGLQTEGSVLTYQKKANANTFSFSYTSPSACDPLSLDGEYKVNFGDGQSAAADCKGVVNHTYTKDGQYTVQYLKDGNSIGQVKVLVKNIATEIEDVSIKGKNTTIITNLAHMRSSAELEYNDSGYSYETVCEIPKVNSLFQSIKNLSGEQPVCADSKKEYVIYASLLPSAKTDFNYWCVDSTGFSKGVQNKIAAGELSCG